MFISFFFFFLILTFTLEEFTFKPKAGEIFKSKQ